MEYIIYYHFLTEDENKIRYVGMTTTSCQDRWRNGKGYQKQSEFYNAIQEAGGWDALTHIILEEGDASPDEIAEREAYWTKYYNADDYQRGGFVKRIGGKHGETTQQFRDQMSETMLDYYQTEQGMITRQKQSQSMMGNTNGLQQDGRKVICIETQTIYKSLGDATRAVGLKAKSSIRNCCNHKIHCNTAGGYHWEWYDESGVIGATE